MNFESVNKLLEKSFRNNWDRPALSNYKGETLFYRDLARQIAKMHLSYVHYGIEPGDKVVILGGGDIGLIMARRMTLCGAQVRMLVAKEATGLVRNHRRCIDPYNIETRYGWGVASIHGYGRLKGVMVAPTAPLKLMPMERPMISAAIWI